jgi:hypothetical protein
LTGSRRRQTEIGIGLNLDDGKEIGDLGSLHIVFSLSWVRSFNDGTLKKKDMIRDLRYSDMRQTVEIDIFKSWLK